jgi:CheY-like chemotaxis protein
MATLAPKHLVVDDEPATRSLMTQVFARIGFAVCAAEDGFAALSEIRLERV